MTRSDDKARNVFPENVIRVGAGFVAKERPHVVEMLSALGPHLARWDPRDVAVDVSLHDRGGKEQRVTVHTTLPGLPALVASDASPDITHALSECKRELIRQIEHQKSVHEPMHNRRLRRRKSRRPAAVVPSSNDPAAGPG
jgi:ribosome-associated translation inhibitor RaiA